MERRATLVSEAYFRHPEFEREVEPSHPKLVGGNLGYEVEAILQHRGKGAQRQYLVSWKWYDLSEASWKLESHLANAPDLLADFLYCIKAEEESTQTKGVVPSAKNACGELP